jgi:hypothetical protein
VAQLPGTLEMDLVQYQKTKMLLLVVKIMVAWMPVLPMLQRGRIDRKLQHQTILPLLLFGTLTTQDRYTRS